MEEDTKWRKIEDDGAYYLNRHAFDLPNGETFIVSLHPVMFGYRVVGMWAHSIQSIEFNWCCGNNKIVMYATQRIIMNLIEQGTHPNDIPFGSDIKPWPKDSNFVELVSKMVKNPILGDIVAVMDGTRPEI